MSSPVPLEETIPPDPGPPGAELPGAELRTLAYAGHARDAQLEYKAILANASIGIAFTRDRKFTLCNPKFAELLGWEAGELIGQPGDVVYPSRESYEALARSRCRCSAPGASSTSNGRCGARTARHSLRA